MYNSSALSRSPEQDAISPSRYAARDTYHSQNVQPMRSFSHGQAQPPSPSLGAPPSVNTIAPLARERPPSTFYDPTSENRERKPGWQAPSYSHRSPILQQSPQSFMSAPSRPERRSFDRGQPSPSATYRSHPSPVLAALPQPPLQDGRYQQFIRSGQAMAPPQFISAISERAPAPHTRVADPMSFSNILSTSDTISPSVSPQVVRKASILPEVFHRSDVPSVDPFLPARVPSSTTSGRRQESNINNDWVDRNGPSQKVPSTDKLPQLAMAKLERHDSNMQRESHVVNGNSTTPRPAPASVKKLKLVVPEKDYQAALARIDAMALSDLEEGDFAQQKHDFVQRTAKRFRDLEEKETLSCKRRRSAHVTKLTISFSRQAVAAKDRYIKAHEEAVIDEVQKLEINEILERKKVAQRNRRRENTKQRAEQQAAELKQRAQETEDRDEKERLIKEAERAQKKASAASKLLKGDTPSKDARNSTPSNTTEPGNMSTLPTADDVLQEPPAKRQRTARLKKSKEQKQAEKDSAAAAQEAIERGEQPVLIAPRLESVRKTATKESAAAKDSDTKSHQSGPSSTYTQMYESIWKDIARREIPKLHKIKESSLTIKQANAKKTVQLAAKEARRWQLKTNKSQKDTQARAKRVMREMLSFWKRNEREERDQRKMAEKHELENAKKQEADREANRQKRKLNFLISQTELYSHFIGKKVKTDEVERSTDDVTVSQQNVKPAAADGRATDLPDSVGELIAKVTNFEDLDFDAADDTALRQAAMANAQNAVQEAQNRARAFNNEGPMQTDFDDGEMNFQNPSGMQDLDIAQPEMLTCQLKEYQLKGLNWLVNLYEQGINGILADEMGLGKTVQSISVMSYLAEKHNIWGPFLVIAPASTLHNWQQEIVKFVPNLKVLPYWGSAKDRKVLRKFWDRKHITYTKDSPFHVLVTSYQLVVQDTQYFQKIRWQYMILDEAQAIKSSQSSRWKSLLGFHCRNRLLLTGTPIQNNMQELWALLHFIMPSLFDSHDEFSDWFSKDIESHAATNTKLNEDQLKRLHMILKPFMLRRIKKHVQKELGDKIEEDVYCDLTYRQRAYYSNLRNKISIMDIIEKAAMGDDNDSATLMNLVMQFRKVCNHPDLFERAETSSPVSFSYFAETASFLREGYNIEVAYSVRSLVEYRLPRLVARNSGRLDIAGPDNVQAGWRKKFLHNTLSIWTPENILRSSRGTAAFSWLRFVDASAGQVSSQARHDLFARCIDLKANMPYPSYGVAGFEDDSGMSPSDHALLDIRNNFGVTSKLRGAANGVLQSLFDISATKFVEQGLNAIEAAANPAALAPPVELYCASQGVIQEKQRTFFNVPIRRALYGISEKTEAALLEAKADPSSFPVTGMLPPPLSEKMRYTKIEVPSMRRFVTDSGKLAKLDQLLRQLKEGNHRVLLYFQMTRMINLMEEYLTYRNYKYCRLDGSTKLEDRRDTVADFQTRPDIFIFLLSTRAGGLGINLTAADTVIFYDSDWNPTIDSQAMDRAHRLGQTRQVTVYRLITRGTIEERIRKRALQKEEVQRVVISGGSGGGVDFNARSRENRTKDIAMWLADDDQAAEIEKKEAEIAEKEAKDPAAAKKAKKAAKKKVDLSLDDMYHEGEGHFDDGSKPSGAATPVVDEAPVAGKGKRKGSSKKAKSLREKLAIADGV